MTSANAAVRRGLALVAHIRDTYDQGLATGAAARAILADLASAADDEEDPASRYVLGWLYWFRYRLSSRQDIDALEVSRRHLTACLLTGDDVDDLPTMLLGDLADAGEPEAHALLEQARHAADPAIAERAGAALTTVTPTSSARTRRASRLAAGSPAYPAPSTTTRCIAEHALPSSRRPVVLSACRRIPFLRRHARGPRRTVLRSRCNLRAVRRRR